MNSNNGRWVLVCTILASSMAFIDGSALNVALPALQDSLNATGSDLLWVLSGYLLFLSSLILVGGALGDRYGRKRVFGAGIVLFTLASVWCGLAPTIDLLIIARAVQGIGAALMVPGSLSIISSYFDGDARGEAIGTWSAFSGISGLAGPVIGGLLTQIGWWRGIFFINVPLAMIALYLLQRYVPESRDESVTGRLDIPGAVLATLALGGISYGAIQASEVGFTPVNIAAVVIGFGMLAAFIFVERRAESPMMPLDVFKSRVFSAANMLTLLLYAALGVVFFLLPQNLIQIQGYSPDIAALALVPQGILLIVISRRAGHYASLHGPRLLLIVGPFLVGVSYVLMALPGLTNGPADYWTTFFPALIASGVGLGLTVAPLSTAVMTAVSKQRSGTASGVNNAVARTANTLAVTLIGGLALVVFVSTLNTRALEVVDLPEAARLALQEEGAKFANAAVPEVVPEAVRADVSQAIKLAFVDTFRFTMVIAAGLAFGSAAIAFLFIRQNEKRS